MTTKTKEWIYRVKRKDIISEYLANVDVKGMDLNEADFHDYSAFCSFFEAIVDYKAANQGH